MDAPDAPDDPDVLAVFRALEPTGNTSYLLDAQLRILRCNAAWAEFARANHGDDSPVQRARGASILDAIAPVLRPYFRKRYVEALATGKVWEHDYECSTPKIYRRFRMLAYPVAGSFLVVTHAPVVEHAHDRPEIDEQGHTANGVIVMCSHCRRTRRASAEIWDWVPAFVASMPANTSHGLCGACAEFYFF